MFAYPSPRPLREEDFTMRLSAIGVILTLAIFWTPRATESQQPTTVALIGVLSVGRPPADWAPSKPFIQQLPVFGQALRDLGYVEGQNIAFAYRYTENLDRLPDLAAELVRLPVDMILPLQLPSALAAQH